jgi:superfamily II DNA or RNA helicase
MKRQNILKKPAKPASEIHSYYTDKYKSVVCSQSYLGKKGYTISKSILHKDDLEFLYKDLFMKPQMFGASKFGGIDENIAFPVYRENTNKIYIPRFYGITRYGMPSRSEIQEGETINVVFPKQLRDYQDKIVDVYMNYVNTPICIGSQTNGGGGILEVPCGRGKCLGKDTKILMFDGSIKLVQDIMVGDLLMGDDSTPRKVLSLARGRETMYKVSSVKGDGYIVNESHILSLKTSSYLEPKGTVIDISVFDYLNLPKSSMESLYGYRVPIHFKEKDVEINPYLLGYWLGDDSSDKIPIEYLIKNIITNRHIPDNYKCNSRRNQLELLAGLLDSYGYYHNECYELEEDSEKLLDDIIFISRSLGFSVLKMNKNEIRINGPGLEEIPVKNINKPTLINNDSLTYQIKLEKLDIDDYYGFEIDGNHRFVLDDFTVTHNTVMALKIISQIQKKTLIIVHKEFLMNQWIERIQEFLPGATVGKIQAQTFDVKGNDIVIGMIQTLYDKEYPPDTFSCFGLTIIDEVHRIGSEQFSKTLFKTITPYMLGISATVDRKDKLTSVLHMFIGDKIYSENRDADDPVCVRAINYICSDPQFNEVDMDYRGNPKYSSMIVKLCEFGPRSDFIVRVLKDLIEEESEKQIMVLCHNRSLLSYLYDAIQYRKFATVGFYVGGMKQTNLQETETKNIVLATYAMAAEALDIKTLSTLVMVTPKTDIIQSVGRILRVKHEKPIIVDIVDAHEPYQKQWAQRRRYYKKCNYRIRQIDSDKYTNMMIDWEEDKTWKRVYEPSDKTKCLNPSDEDEDEKNPTTIFGGVCKIDIRSLEGLDD